MKNSVKNTVNAVTNSNVNFAFMAFGKGQEVKEFAPIPKYEGLATCEVLGVNLNKAELEALGFKQDNEPVYVMKDDKGNDSIKLDFIIRTDKEKCGVELTTRATFWLKSVIRQKQDGSKQQVVDAYGNTAWVTADEFMAKTNILTKNDGTKYKAAIATDYRGAYEGEEKLYDFIRTYLGIMKVFAYINNEWVENPKLKEKGIVPAECMCAFTKEDIVAMLKGDFTAIKEAIAGQPEKRVKMLIGTKSTEVDGKTRTYQQVYTNNVLYGFAKDYKYIEQDLNDANFTKTGDHYVKNNVSYYVGDIREVSVEATSFATGSATNTSAPQPKKSWGFAN